MSTNENNPTTKTTEEAMDLLGNHRSYYIAMARYVAVQIAMGKKPWIDHVKDVPGMEEPGTVHSYAVRVAMEKGGVLDGYTGKLHFLGTAMRADVFQRTGKTVSYSHNGDVHSVHQRTVQVWNLKPGSAPGAVVEPKMPDDIAKRQREYREAEAKSDTLREQALREKRFVV